jgi:ABC-2 type transport system permease protein
MHAVWALAWKDLVILLRDRFGLFWVVAFPLLMALFFGSIFGSGSSGARGMRLAFTGTGDSASVSKFRTALGRSASVTLEELPLDSARSLVARGKKTAYVHFTDTTHSIFGFFGPAKPSIEIGIDPARKTEAGYLEGLVYQAYFSLVADALTNTAEMRPGIREQLQRIDTSSSLDQADRSRLRNLFGSLDEFLASVDTVQAAGDTADTADADSRSPFAEPTITVEQVTVAQAAPRSTWEVTFPQAMQWALIGVAAAFAVGLVTERRCGTFLRLSLAPISRFQILAGKGLACFIAAVTACLLLLAIGILVFHVRVASWPLLAASVACSAFCFVGLMMFISVLGKTERGVAGAGWAILLVMSMTGGGMVPLFIMPTWMYKLGSFSAVKWSVLALEGAIWRGFGPSDMMLPLAVLVGMGAAGLAVGTAVLSKSE